MCQYQDVFATLLVGVSISVIKKYHDKEQCRDGMVYLAYSLQSIIQEAKAGCQARQPETGSETDDHGDVMFNGLLFMTCSACSLI